MQFRTMAALLVLAFPTALVGAQGTPRPTTDLPVRSVVLFSSGVGFFDHAGTVSGNGTAELRFKAAQINDVLKSLTLQDLDGGRVTTVTYPSQDPISKTLRSFEVDITGNPNMTALLNQLRGTKVTVQYKAETLTGAVLGVELHRKAVDKGEPVETSTLNLLTGGTIRSLDLSLITALTLDDPKLQDELTRALAALSSARDQDKKPVTINFLGAGDRRVRIGYVVETPIWKTSYRLMIDDKSAHLQGWAIVENQTESDWNNVSLSLVSGRPISFIMDLYAPLYVQRETVVQNLFAGLRPKVYEAGETLFSPPVGNAGLTPRDEVATRQSVTAEMVRSLPVDRLGQALALQPGVSRVDANALVTAGASASVQSLAEASQLGELFQYVIPNVTLARQKSAMIPIVTDSVGIERLSIYNASVLPANPLNGARMKNTTGKHLQQGPITVLEKNSYAGDAQIDNIPPGQSRLMSYGVDLDVHVDNTHSTYSSALVTAVFKRGGLYVTRKRVSASEYRIDNKGTKDKTILVEHPRRGEWKLKDSASAVETTPSAYRFEKLAPAGRLTVLTVEEQVVDTESIAMIPTPTDVLVSFSTMGQIPQRVRDAIVKAIELKRAVEATEAQIADRMTQIASITAEQARIRENMKTVAQKSAYYDRLLSKLNDQESAIERLQKERDDLVAKRDTERAALDEYLSKLTIE